jgi:starch phosphorylase
LPDRSIVAYFSMEIALEPGIPTYSGGLGGLAGDTVRSAADLGISMVAVSLVHRRGYFRQRLDPTGQQHEDPDSWAPEQRLERLEPRVTLAIGGRRVTVVAWRYTVRGISGDEVPVVLLDSDLDENHTNDRRLTDSLYGGDARYRLCQEAILGIGGVKMLRALGHDSIHRFHLNEGHAALAVLALLDERVSGHDAAEGEVMEAFEELRSRCVFTTHTPVAAGHDQFKPEVARSVLGERDIRWLAWVGDRENVNLTDLALRAAHFVNGVAMRHREVSQSMFPNYPIHSITNGIHPATWASPPFRDLFDDFVPKWRTDAFALRYAVSIPVRKIACAHRTAKHALLERVNQVALAEFDRQALTIGFARRATAYKRATLVFSDVERLVSIAREAGPLQLVFAGKAHPQDWEGKALIQRVFEAGNALKGKVAVAYLPDYGIELAKLLVAGCDVWLNTPVPPLEASGTSGMKAALNGVPSLSVLDGWWIEGHVEGVTGWSIGQDHERFLGTSAAGDAEHAQALYDKLEFTVIPTYYGHRRSFHEMMRHAIALNASFFNSQRMALQYLYDAY